MSEVLVHGPGVVDAPLLHDQETQQHEERGHACGTWYLIARADGEDAVAERDETNNTRSRRLMIR
jgi:hypothetical protein